MKKIGLLTLMIIVSLVLLIGNYGCKNSSPKELRVLAWVGYEEDDIVKPFEKEFGVKVLTETFTGADKMFAKITQNPDAYDIVVIDPEYISKLNNAGILSELDKNKFAFDDYIQPFKDFPLCTIDGKYLAVLIRFGVNAIVYNTEKLSKEEVSSYKILLDPKVKGKVGIWDWYLPNMGCFSAYLNLNPKNPYDLSQPQQEQLFSFMNNLKPQVKAIHGSFSDINNALSRGDIWVVPALGEHTAAVLSEQGLPIDWIVPKEGGIMWIETLGIPKMCKNRDAAINYIKYMQRPETQAKLTWRKAYRSNIPSVSGIALLNKKQQDALKVHNGQDATALVNSIFVRMLPTNEMGVSMEKEWQAAWQNFKSTK